MPRDAFPGTVTLHCLPISLPAPAAGAVILKVTTVTSRAAATMPKLPGLRAAATAARAGLTLLNKNHK